MAQPNKNNAAKVVAISDLTAGVRTIGSLLGQLDVVGLGREEAIEILLAAGLPAQAYDDPSFPVSQRQDLEILNDIRKHMWTEVSMEVGLFSLVNLMKVHMFGALGMAWQCAPTMREAIAVSVSYPEVIWGRTQMALATSDEGVYLEYEMEKNPNILSSPEETEATYRYALLLEVISAAAIILDISQDRSFLTRIEIPFDKPDDWSRAEKYLSFEVVFNATKTRVCMRPGFLQQVPKKAHELSYKMAKQLVAKESAFLAEDSTARDQVVRWLWAYTPPLKKAEIAKILGYSERSLTRQLAAERCSYNELFAEVQSERAMNLLGNKRLTVSEVAYRMGYSDPAAFTRAFTLWQGTTPSKWRSSNKVSQAQLT